VRRAWFATVLLGSIVVGAFGGAGIVDMRFDGGRAADEEAD